MMKKAVCFFLIFIIILSFNATIFAMPIINGESAIVMDYETGEILYSKNENKRCIPASMTKVMTVYVVFDAIKKGEISLDTKVSVSDTVLKVANRWPEVVAVPMKKGQIYTVDELIKLTMVLSACDAATALAEAVSGSLEAFVDRMNKTAWEMGLDAMYVDPSGLENSYITPLSMAHLARNIICEYPQILDITRKKEITVRGKKYKSTNLLLSDIYYAGIDGLKTGSTSAAGACFCGTGVKNGTRLIAVVFKSNSLKQRFYDAKKLFDYGFEKADTLKYIYTTDIKTSVDGNLVPTFYSYSIGGGAVVIAEDLKDYGFDTEYNHSDRTLYLTHNEGKEITPIPMNYYNSLKNNAPFMKISKPKTIKVVLMTDNGYYEFKNVIQLDGYTAISSDELGKLSKEFGYDNQSRTVNINF